VPRMGPIGKCNACGRLLVSDVYSLCWRCACSLIEAPMPDQAHADRHPAGFVEALYVDLGGES
jgi:hypothetical protein